MLGYWFCPSRDCGFEPRITRNLFSSFHAKCKLLTLSLYSHSVSRLRYGENGRHPDFGCRNLVMVRCVLERRPVTVTGRYTRNVFETRRRLVHIFLGSAANWLKSIVAVKRSEQTPYAKLETKTNETTTAAKRPGLRPHQEALKPHQEALVYKRGLPRTCKNWSAYAVPRGTALHNIGIYR